MENEALVLQIKTGENSEEAMEQLFLQNRGFIYGIAKKYAAYADIDDLMQESYFGLLKAVEGFEPEQGNKFTTFLFPCLNRTFQRYISDTKNTKRIPEYLRIRIAKYKNFLAECSADGKEAADSEICAALGISKEQLSNLRKAIHESECISTSDFVTGTDDITVESVLADPADLEEQVTEAVAQEQLAAQLWKIVDELGGKQSEVISERYHYSKTLEEIAEQMGLSYERIRQIEKKALEILHQKEKLQNIAECYGYLESSKAYKGGLRSFKEHGGSIVEYLALKNVERAEHEQPKQENIDKLFEDILNLATN